ncbi:MAG: hypothetical protein H6642_14295 [Caldilineaceae bacterium]|nr:hypothetical protein [Caldilineaceae bacterium]
MQTLPLTDLKAGYLAHKAEIDETVHQILDSGRRISPMIMRNRQDSQIENLYPEAPYYFCTYFDRNYLTRGLTLYKSLQRHCKRSFVLWILCFDNDTYNILARLKLPGIRLISQQEFETGDEELIRVKADRSRVEYYWTCTPSLPLYVLYHNPGVDLISYLDADLCFYADPQPIYDELGTSSILIHEHRYAPEHAYLEAISGVYNVGLMAFRRDEQGLACLHWWRARCLEWCYARTEDGKFGDQKYLDDWPQQFNDVTVLQHKGAGLAPWNLTQYHFKARQQHIVVDGDPLIFFHFHGLRCISRRVIEPAGYGYRLPPFIAARLFVTYANALKRAADMTGRPFADLERSEMEHDINAGLLDQRLLLIQPQIFATLLWRLAGWRRNNKDKIAAGYAAYRHGDLPSMRQHFLQATWRNPLILTNLGILSLLIESIIGSSAMARYRAWRHGT